MALRKELISQIVAMFPNEVSIVRPAMHSRSRLRLFNRLTVSVYVVRSALIYKNNRRWFVETVRNERNFITLMARLDENNHAILDLHVLPNINRTKTFQLSLNDSWLTRGKRLTELSQFLNVLERIRANRRLARHMTT
jgi:hypothetical protein